MLAQRMVILALAVSFQGSVSMPELARQVTELGRQLRIEKVGDATTYERVRAAGGVERMRTLLTQYTEAVLNGAPDADAVAIQGRLSLAYSPWKPTPNEAGGGRYTATTPEVFRSSLGGRRIVYVSWLIWVGSGGAPDSQFMFQAYVESNGHFSLRAQTGELFDRHTEFVDAVPSKRVTEAWFMCRGTRFGSSRVDMAVSLYAFDGTRFLTRWSRPRLDAGQVTLSATGVHLEYRDADWRTFAEDLLFTTDGLATQSRREIRGRPLIPGNAVSRNTNPPAAVIGAPRAPADFMPAGEIRPTSPWRR